MAAYAGSVEAELEMKPIDLCDLIRSELGLGYCDGLKPKQIVELGNSKLGRPIVGGDRTVKEEAASLRAAIRKLPPRFWDPDIAVAKNSNPQSLVAWLVAKPASAGGFAGVVACSQGAKMIDTKTIHTSGGCEIDGFSVLQRPGAYSTVDHDMVELQKLFKNDRNALKIGDCAFQVQERAQPEKAQTTILGRSNKCNARFVGLLTPKWMAVGLYHFSSTEAEALTFALFEEFRKEAFSAAPVVPPPQAVQEAAPVAPVAAAAEEPAS
mmetsp:Transcript_6937/g.15884  ORF Transcript_6937/g.15884 Transcript_6937/m.15884 type:complete len:267 (+) Transcript_6937:129-929(+)